MANAGFKPPERNTLSFDAETGKIYRFQAGRIEVLRLGKPYPAAYLKTARGKVWQNQLPKTRFPFLFSRVYRLEPEGASEALKKFLAYSQSLYESVAAYVGPDRVASLDQFHDRHWFLYCLLANGGDRAQDLMRSNPSLAYLLSAHAVFHPLAGKRYWRSTRSLLGKKRREILGHFGFPGSEAAVKLFARIGPDACANDLFFILRKQLRESPELLRQLSFFPRHNYTSVRLICSKLRHHFSYHALSEIAAQGPGGCEEDIRYKILDIQRMRGLLKTYGIPQPEYFLRTLRETGALHDDLAAALNRLHSVPDQPYPAAPLEDVKRGFLRIENICGSEALQQEGREMSHCIFSYHDSILRGDCHAARMLVPERLTILYRGACDHPRGGRELELVDARGRSNAKPLPGSLQLIQQWLRRSDLAYYDPDQLCIFEESILDEMLG